MKFDRVMIKINSQF